MALRRQASFLALFFLPACASFWQAAPAPLNPAPPFELGVNTHVSAGPELAQAYALGARWARVDLVWAGMEPEPGRWHFEPFDQAVAAARKAGLRVYANLLYTPKWASRGGKSSSVPDRAAWQAFVRTAARRYGPQVDVFGIWNEPNLEEFWEGSTTDYVEVLLKPAFRILRAEAPQSRVAGPELAHLYSATLQPAIFLDQLARLGGGDCLDILAHHTYGNGDFEAKLAGFHFAGLLYRQGLRQMLGASGLWGKPVWITEFGADSAVLGEAAQAGALASQVEALRGLGWVQAAFVYELKEDPAHPQRWGLLRPDLSPKPAFRALQVLFNPPPQR